MKRSRRISFIGVARLFLPLFGFAERREPYGLCLNGIAQNSPYALSLFVHRQILCHNAHFVSFFALRASPSVKLIWLPKIRKKDPQGVLFRIGVARLFSPLFGFAEWLEPYGLHARVQRKIHHSFSLRSNIGGFCRTDFVSSSGTPPNTQRATPAGRLFVYRGSQIRTDDILLPKQTLYQAELHPEVLQI